MRFNLINNRIPKKFLIFTTTFLFIGILVLLSGCNNGRYANILSFGAESGIASYDNSESIQKAIDQVNESGGGRVVIPAGDFYTHPIELKSGVELHLESGAKLIGVDNIEAYTKLKYKKNPALIFADGKENISVTGTGTIDGQGGASTFQVEGDPGGRPMIILFHDCKDVTVTDVTLTNSAH